MSNKMVAILMVACMAVFGGLFVSTASAAGIPIGGQDGPSLGGSFDQGSGNYPSLGSNSNTDGSTASGSFWLNLNPNTTSLAYANWSFYTNSQDTSMWTAQCDLHGFLNSSESWPQSQNWSQSLESGSASISARRLIHPRWT